MIHFFNAKFAGACWLCRADIIRGDKLASIPYHKSGELRLRSDLRVASKRTVCLRCGNAYAARMAEHEESRRAAHGHALRLGGEE